MCRGARCRRGRAPWRAGPRVTSRRGREPTVSSRAVDSAPSSRSIAIRRNDASGDVVASTMRARSRGLLARSEPSSARARSSWRSGGVVRCGANCAVTVSNSASSSSGQRDASSIVAVSVPEPTATCRERGAGIEHGGDALVVAGGVARERRVRPCSRTDAEAQLRRRCGPVRARRCPRRCRRACAAASSTPARSARSRRRR